MSEDSYAFEFETAASPTPLHKYLQLGSDNGVAFRADEIVLFSGGLDSLSGAVEELVGSTKKIALVNRRSSSKIFSNQRQLVAELKQRFPKRLMHIPVLVTGQETCPVRERTPRSRSFLYTALGCVVAALFDDAPIRFFENGVVSINLPISAQVVGARATRTTHPLVLERYREFFSAAIGKSVDIENPFIWKTKTDVIGSLVARGCGPLIRHTVSCTRSYEITKLHIHCGCCSQCLDRRFAMLAAKASEHDPADKYKVELLTGARERQKDQTMAESYVRSALELADMSEHAFFDRFAGETARVCSGFPTLKSDDVARDVIDLHQRHGQAIWGVLNAALANHSAELLKQRMPMSSVLIMSVVPGTTPTISIASKQRDPWESLTKNGSPNAAGGIEGTGVAPRKRHKRKPKLERARNAIKELYPKGVPDQTVEPNPVLLGRVGENSSKLAYSASPMTPY